MELKPNMYARTNQGYIGKLKIKKETIAVAQWAGDYKLEEITQYFVNDNRYNEFEIIKVSHNIIDLIKVGDYVNGHKVLEVNQFSVEVESNAIENETWEEIEDYEIETIVTKEQFSSMEYKVNE